MGTKLDVFQVVADSSRRHILQMLTQERMTVNAIASNFQMSRPAVSKHLKILQENGFISIEDHGRERHCLLHQQGFDQLQEWMAYFDVFWKSKLHGLEKLMDEKEGNKE